MTLKPDQFTDAQGRRYLTDDGIPGMDGVEGRGSSSEKVMGQLAAALAQGRLNKAQLDQLQAWAERCKPTPAPLRPTPDAPATVPNR